MGKSPIAWLLLITFFASSVHLGTYDPWFIRGSYVEGNPEGLLAIARVEVFGYSADSNPSTDVWVTDYIGINVTVKNVGDKTIFLFVGATAPISIDFSPNGSVMVIRPRHHCLALGLIELEPGQEITLTRSSLPPEGCSPSYLAIKRGEVTLTVSVSYVVDINSNGLLDDEDVEEVATMSTKLLISSNPVKLRGSLLGVQLTPCEFCGFAEDRMEYLVEIKEVLASPEAVRLDRGTEVEVMVLGPAKVGISEGDVGSDVEVLGAWVNGRILLLNEDHYIRRLEFVLEPYDSAYTGQTSDVYFNDEVAGKYFPKFCVKPGAEPGPMIVFYRIFRDAIFGDLTIQYLVVFPRQEGWKPHLLDYSLVHIHLNKNDFKPILIEYDAGFSPGSLELHSKGEVLWEEVHKIDGRPVMIVKDAYHTMLAAKSPGDLAGCTTTEGVRLDRLSDDVLDHYYGLADIGTELGTHRLNQFLNGLGWNTMNPNEVVQPVTDANIPWSVRVTERGDSIELNIVSTAGAKVSAFLTVSSGNELKVYNTPVENVPIESGTLERSIKESDLTLLASYTTDPAPLDPRVRGVIAWIVIYYPDPGGAIVRRVTVKAPLEIFDPNTLIEIVESYFMGSESEFLGREPTADDVLLALDAYFGG